MEHRWCISRGLGSRAMLAAAIHGACACHNAMIQVPRRAQCATPICEKPAFDSCKAACRPSCRPGEPFLLSRRAALSCIGRATSPGRDCWCI